MGVNHEERIRKALHIFDAREVLFQVFPLSFELQDFFLRQELVTPVFAHLFQIPQALD
jgi:hypothetical protein